MEDKEKTQYRGIMKAVSIFGGVQIYIIGIGILRSKFIALILGPTGIGLSGVFNSAIALVKSITSAGLSSSAIRDLSTAYGTGDKEKIARVYSVINKLVWCTGVLGLIVTFLFSPFLSYWMFESNEYTYSFMLLSAVLLFAQLTARDCITLQAFQKIKLLARANIYSASVSLILAVPLYWFWGIKAVVPVLVISAGTTFFITKKVRNNINIETSNVSLKEAFFRGKEMLTLGIVMSLCTVLTTLTSFLIRGYVIKEGGLVEVGLYAAGLAIVTTYVDLFFTALGKDYYPRLASVINNREETQALINKQCEICVLTISPFLILFLIFMPFVTILLYSKDFLPVTGFIVYAISGTLFRIVTSTILYLIICKGDSKAYFFNELSNHVFLLFLSYWGYSYLKLEGLGIAIFLTNLFYFVQSLMYVFNKYSFRFEQSFIKIFIFEVFIFSVGFSVLLFLDGFYKTLFSILILLLSSIYSYFELNSRLDFKSIIQQKRRKKS